MRGTGMAITDFALNYFSLAGKNAIVTGGNTGLGQAFSLALAAGGANVFVPSLADDDGSTKQMVEAAGACYEFMQADITENGQPKRVVDACVDRLGSLDVLINSAGICPLGEVLEFGREKWDATVQVNLTAAFEMSFEAAQRMVPHVQLPRRPAVARLLGHQARDSGADQGVLRRTGGAQHSGQRYCPRLLRDCDHHQHAQ